MRRRWCAAIFGIVAGGLVAVAPPLRAQVPGSTTAVADTDSTVVPHYRLTPKYTNKMNADVNSIGMSNEFGTGLLTPWGSIFDFLISGGESNYRLQNRFDENKLMRATDTHTFSPFLSGNVNFTDSRVFNRSIAVGGGVQDFIINDRSVNAGSNYAKAFDKLRTDMAGTASAANGERTFKTDRTLAAGVNGGVSYSFGDHVVWQGRGALRGADQRSQTADSTFNGLGSSEDSLSTAIHVDLADSIRFDASHTAYSGDRDFADQTRGSLGAQTGGAEDLFVETEMRDTRNTTLDMSSTIFPRLTIKLSAMHDEQVFDYAIQQTRYSRTVGDGVTGSVDYLLPWKSKATLSFENNSTLRDLGPESISSLTDKRKRVALALIHQFTRTLQVAFNGSSQIQQSFYLKYNENPRDRDQVDTSFNLRITSQPFKKMSASVSLGYTNSEFVNIDSTQSGNNRTREFYELRPGFTYVVTPNFTIIQTYGIAIEYTDYTYQSTQNFLDRNLSFTNDFQFKPMKATRLDFKYELYLHDTGSYLPDPDTGERLLNVASKDRRDRTTIRVDYMASKSIAFFAENLYNRREARTTGSDQVDVTTDGQIAVGTTANYDWGNYRTLRLMMSRVKRFSPFGAEAEKNYWNATSEFVYPF